MPLVLTLLACGQLSRYDEPDDGVRVQPAAELDDEGEDEPGPKAGANATNDGDGDGIERRDDCDDDDDTVFPGAVEDCGDGVDSDCDGNDCADWEDGFEGNGGEFDRPWYDGGVADWTLKRNLAHDGTWCAVSGNIDDQGDRRPRDQRRHARRGRGLVLALREHRARLRLPAVLRRRGRGRELVGELAVPAGHLRPEAGRAHADLVLHQGT